jgi:hypothetical protein
MQSELSPRKPANKMTGTHIIVLEASDHTRETHRLTNESKACFPTRFAEGTMNVTNSDGSLISSKSPMNPLQIPSTYFMNDTIK